MKSRPNVRIFETSEQLAAAAAEHFVESSLASIQDHNSFGVALAGGTTPRESYKLLATDRFQIRLDWSKIHLFFGDERMVAPDSPQSNYRMVHDALISRVPIPRANVHRIEGEAGAEESVEHYQAALRSYFGDVAWPRFDLVWLGMGDDGHTASLFPGDSHANESSAWVVSTLSPDNQPRVSLTLPVINHAARIDFLVSGKGKAERLAQVLGDASDKKLPAQKVAPVNGTLQWLVDRDAAALL
ncbi:MAG TPA: 6-phosphogluconolactonase [Pyrinomonadaceae bacterium]|nr:6-phosphogluconolactonase [Pyrinomonadaceae bacterium]